MTADELYDILVEWISLEAPIMAPLVRVFIWNMISKMTKLSHLPIERARAEVSAWLTASHSYIMEHSADEILQFVDAELRARADVRARGAPSA